MLIVIFWELLFFIFLIAQTYFEDWRDSLWFYSTAGKGKQDPQNLFWHVIKPHEAILGWITGALGVVFLYYTWTIIAKNGDWLTAALFMFTALVVIWSVRVKLHLYFLRRFKLKLRGSDK